MKPYASTLSSPTRRTFLQAIAAGAVCILTARPTLAGIPKMSRFPGLASLELDHFRAVLGTSFRVQFEGRESSLSLIEATAIGPSAAPTRTFSLLFAGGPGLTGQQGIYDLSHPLLGRHSVFLVPSSEVDQSVRFLAIFNRVDSIL